MFSIFLFNKLNFCLDLKYIFCYTNHMKTMTLGKLLALPHFHHFYNLPISENWEGPENYIVVFEQNGQAVFVDLESKTGHTNEARFASHFPKHSLLIGLGAVPVDSWSTCQVLGVKKNNTQRGIALANLVEHYGHLSVFKEIAEKYRLRERSTIYDPYRYSYTIDEKNIEKDSQLNIVPRKEYEKIRDFHPFLQTNRGNVYAVPCIYKDDKRNKETKIYIMGWYFYEKQLKISWKPSHSRKSRWRSSIVSVDKITDQYFFQGELYKKGSFPIFLDNLVIKNRKFQEKLDKEYINFIRIIEKQKNEAKLRIK
ncbi:TPA: hypothetical protein U0616_000719 [Streptococcus suis]|nr:hypothetical protein [Streptococcus suis]